MTARFRGPGRRGLRDEVQSTWSVYDASRPLRKSDLAEPPPPEVAASVADTSNRAATPDGGARTCDAVRLDGPHGSKPITLDKPEDVCRFETATDENLAMLFGVTVEDVQESRRWAREQAEKHPAGIATVTSIDANTKH